jgi:hypothetical protein
MQNAGRFKYVLVGVAILVVIAALVATGAFPANEGSLQVMSPVTIGGTKAGGRTYTAHWGGFVVITEPAMIVPSDHAFRNDNAVLDTSDGNLIPKLCTPETVLRWERPTLP